jgi:FkbM family methyltransferase
VKGVVHVGAHKGEEVEAYLSEGRSPIICFEPQNLAWPFPDSVTLVRCALDYVSHRMMMKVPFHLHCEDFDTQSASGLTVIPEREKEIGWSPHEYDFIRVDAVRFDEWARANGFESGSCSLLAVDVQGMEFQVLDGFGDYLNGFSEIVAECSSPPVYFGEADTSDVSELLAKHGFERVSPTVAHGDVRFTRSEN